MKKYAFIYPLLCYFLTVGCSKPEGQIADSPKSTPSSERVAATYAKGADVGWLTQMEASGIKFYNNSGTQQDIFTILKGKGMNSIRLRVWVNPAGGRNNQADVIAKAKRAKAAGMRIMIDFHYSDSWADPG